MKFSISDIFTASLAKLTGDEQKSVKMTAFDPQMNPANPVMKLHKLFQDWNKHFLMVRMGSETFIKHPSVRNVAMTIGFFPSGMAAAVNHKTIGHKIKLYNTMCYKNFYPKVKVFTFSEVC